MALIKICPKCGSNMKLSDSLDNNLRYWECSNKLSFKYEDCCSYTETVQSDHQLSINEIATNFKTASRFIGSDELKKDQANIRRILGGLKKLKVKNYLSSDEAEAFKLVQEFLERFGDAAERAKKAKKQEEKAEELRVSQRRKQAGFKLEKRFDSDKLPVLIVHAMALSKVDRYIFRSLDIKELTDIKFDIEMNSFQKPYTRIVNEVRYSFKDGLESLIDGIARDKAPIDELLQDKISKIEELISEIETKNSKFLEDYNCWLVQQRLNEANPSQKDDED